MSRPAINDLFPGDACQFPSEAIWNALDEDVLGQLKAIGRPFTLDQGQALFHEGDRDRCLYGIKKGAIRLLKVLPDGRRQIVGFRFSGDLIGFSIAGIYAYSAEAMVDTALCCFNRQRLTAVMERQPVLEHTVLEFAARELIQAQNHLIILGRKSASERVATILLRLADRIGCTTGDQSMVELPMSREDLADYAGLTMETISRQISRFRQMGFIETPDFRRIFILKRCRLMQLSGDI